MRVGALCAGYGGLELGLGMELVWYAESDVHAGKVLAHHHPELPNLGDITGITETPPVDVVAAGFPCQPVSVAGKGRGTDDERWLIDDVVRIWRRNGARWLFLENVPGLYHAQAGRAFEEVVDALAEVGATVEWSRLRASAVGAPHRRERWFALASHADSGRREGVGGFGEVWDLEPECWDDVD